MAETNWMVLFSAVIGGLIAYGANYFNANLQLRNSLKLEQDKLNKAKEEQAFKAYNQILSVAGEFNETIFEEYNLWQQFNFDGYQKLVRIHIYENFHLLDDEVKNLVKNLDILLDRHRFYQEIGDFLSKEEHDQATTFYIDLLREVERIVWRKGES